MDTRFRLRLRVPQAIHQSPPQITLLLVVAYLCFTGSHIAIASGVKYDTLANEYSFSFEERVLYRYSLKRGGTFAALTAMDEKGKEFWPSASGGIRGEFGGAERNPWDPEVTYRLIRSNQVADTVVVVWEMRADGQAIQYQYRVYIHNRTLSIEVGVLGESRIATGVVLDRGLTRESGQKSARRICVPYLTLCNILLLHDLFTSMYFDWERTHCSKLTPYAEFSYKENSVNYSQMAEYQKRTDGRRNVVQETILLTVSPILDDVLPEVHGSVAPRIRDIAGKTIFSYFSPFPWLLNGVPKEIDPGNLHLIDTLRALGVRNLYWIIKNWNNGQFDNKYPVFLPADTWRGWENGERNWHPPGGGGGNNALHRLRDLLVGDVSNPYEFALHENYVDYYTNTSHVWGWDPKKAARDPHGVILRSFQHPVRGPIPVMKASWAPRFAAYWSRQIANTFSPTWGYLDVHSGIDPSRAVDYDAGPNNPDASEAGMLLPTIRHYRELPSILRGAYRGPVQGEGGNQFLYAGYFDDFDGTINTADPHIGGVNAPMLVNFDLLRIHPLSSQHGVGHLKFFLRLPPNDSGISDTTDDAIQKFIATELAFGHGGLVSKADLRDRAITHALWEYQHVQPMQKAYMGATTLSIEYWDGYRMRNASDYIRLHPGYADIRNRDEFMGRVKVTYINGTEVYVNRSGLPWSIAIGSRKGWYTWNIVGEKQPGRGTPTSTTLILKPECGWLGFIPPAVSLSR